ncbi:MAG TPA: hypothetical protein VET48_13795 [Steroidobacteraceae bacterium]|nr:hypothetical protein [Steroidobacteraceae bacterium]
MESELAKYAEQKLVEAAKRMTQEERLATYIEHCRQVYAFYLAGKKMREQEQCTKGSKL